VVPFAANNYDTIPIFLLPPRTNQVSPKKYLFAMFIKNIPIMASSKTSKVNERHVKEMNDIHDKLDIKLNDFDDFMDFISSKPSTMIKNPNIRTRDVKQRLQSIQRCYERFKIEVEEWSKMVDDCLNKNDDHVQAEDHNTYTDVTDEESYNESIETDDSQTNTDVLRDEKKKWLWQMNEWLRLPSGFDEGISSTLDKNISTIESTKCTEEDINNVHLKDSNENKHIIWEILETIMEKMSLKETDDYYDAVIYVTKYGKRLMELFEYKNITIAVKKLSFMFQKIKIQDLQRHKLWGHENPDTKYRDVFGAFISFLYKPDKAINIRSWISNFKIENEDRKKEKSHILCGFFNVECAKIYDIIDNYLVRHMNNEGKRVEMTNIHGENKSNYGPLNEKARIRNGYADKLLSKKIHTYNDLYEFLYDWLYVEPGFKATYFYDFFDEESNPELTECVSELVVVCWFMDNNHTLNIAKSMALCVSKCSCENSLAWNIKVLKNVLFKLYDATLETQQQLLHDLQGTLSQIILPEELDKIQLLPSFPHDTKPVLRGENALTLIKRVDGIDALQNKLGKQTLYEVIRNPPYHQNMENNHYVLLNKDELEKHHVIPADIAENDYLNWLHHKRSYIRVASWNACCSNKFDLPKTEDDLEAKLNNIVNVIVMTSADLIALQELPLKLKTEKKSYSFDEFKKRLLEKMYNATFHHWDMVYSTAFHESTDEIKTKDIERLEIYAFLFNRDVVSYTSIDNEVQKILDKREKTNRLKRLPCFGKFKSNQLEIILCNVHLAPKKEDAQKEIKDLGTIVLPALKEQFVEDDYQKIIFVGDFNMSYTREKGRFCKPKPDQETWLEFMKNNYVPCITSCYTNVKQDKCFDNFWMHYSLKQLQCFNRCLVTTNTTTKGVFNMRSIPDIDVEYCLGQRGILDFKKKYSDHNPIFVDLNTNTPMYWSTRPQIVINKPR
jgi:endonuclease/exonuclease/phosphatase family metal-dependent hydrolase